MNRVLLPCIALTAAASLAGAGELDDMIAQGGVVAPERLTDGSINPQRDPDHPFILMPLSALPDDITPVIVAGDPNGVPTDSPTQRIDPNNLASIYAGTAHLFIGNAFLCTATPVADRFLISAGHCVDSNDNGTNDFGTNIRITFNASGNNSTVVFPSGVAAVYTHPNYTGFNNPNVNDDIIIIELVNDLPAEIPRYPVYRGTLSSSSIIELCGYGTTGDAVSGYINGSASFNTKRSGKNRPDRGFFADDEGSGTAEIFQYDFDSWQSSGSLGNDIETTVGGGDSGGPSYIMVNGHLELWGVNTFTAGNAPHFGSLGGGILVNGYLDFIDSHIDPVPGVFDLTAPMCGAVDQAPAVALDWQNSTLADSYSLTIATDMALNNVVYSQAGLTVSNHIVSGSALASCTHYYWSVTAINTNGQTEASNAVCEFTTGVAGDLNNDGVVDTADLGGLLGSFGGTGTFADINGDGIVDTADLGILLNNFGNSCN
ncbi:MAG: trypsin-like serine protease [Phycisphaeraceae bacterium]|nr:trypsin-like serine protease [Phycisphaeraceae bacterium]MCB9847237.1 trypsin-like serine protease [Phycisphaeraceae bacterium]